jgi:hypothetical protein
MGKRDRISKALKIILQCSVMVSLLIKEKSIPIQGQWWCRNKGSCKEHIPRSVGLTMSKTGLINHRLVFRSMVSGLNPGGLLIRTPGDQALSADYPDKGFSWSQRRCIKVLLLYPILEDQKLSWREVLSGTWLQIPVISVSPETEKGGWRSESLGKVSRSPYLKKQTKSKKKKPVAWLKWYSTCLAWGSQV